MSIRLAEIEQFHEPAPFAGAVSSSYGGALRGEESIRALPPLGSPFDIRLDFFSGPMDLLLHLVSQQEVSIDEVEMSQVCEQYLEIVSRHASLIDLDRASEYLVIAATLLAIKSGALLPPEPGSETEDYSSEYFDSRFFEDLRARLKTYQVTKDRALALRRAPQLGIHIFTRNDRAALLPTPEMLAEPEDVLTLGNLFTKLLKRVGRAGDAFRVVLEPVSVVNFMMRIVDRLSGLVSGNDLPLKPRQSFRELVSGFFSDGRAGNRSFPRSVPVGSFLALLELMKRGLVSASQANERGDIEIELKMRQGGEEGEDSAEMVSEFDSALTSESEEAPVAGRDTEAPASSDNPDSNVFRIADYRMRTGE